MIFGRSSIGYISDRSRKWSVPWHVVSNRNQAGAIDYLRGSGRLAVIPSLGDNFPNTVLECVGAGVPFVATNIGGIPEIIASADRSRVCVDPRPEVLANRIRVALEQGAASARPSASFTDTERKWIRWHASLANRGQRKRPLRSARRQGREESIFPLVSVCFAYNVRETGGAATLASLMQQDYPHFEIILAECGNGGPPSAQYDMEAQFKGEGWHRIAHPGLEMGGARNAAAHRAKGEYLMFLDDHSTLLQPNALSVFVQVGQRTGADVVTSTLSFFVGSTAERFEHSRRPFLGGDVATGAFVNCFGSPNALIRRQAFEAIGGFSAEAVTTLDDWEFFSRAALMGLRIETIPEVLLGYREDQDQESFVHSMANAVRSVRPYTSPDRKIVPRIEQFLAKAVLLSQGLKFERDAIIGTPLSRGEQGPAVTG